MTQRIAGIFEVTMTQQPIHDEGVKTGLGRNALAKRYHGDLDATGIGEMLAVGTATPGSAGYVALEQVDGTLAGRRGSFVLQHSGTLDRGVPQLTVMVVPDSGTGDLVGLTGRLAIHLEGREHRYDFEYEFVAPAPQVDGD